jgi:transcriptional regulator with XRE-family HTH domain
METCKSCGDPATKELNGSPYCHECWDELVNGVIAPLPDVLLYEENGKEFKRPKSKVTYDDILAHVGERQGKYVVHIADLCREHGIDVKHRRRGSAVRAHWYIKIPPIRSDVTYATALHEIGHLLGNMQDGDRLEHEVGAWEWAKDNALAWSDRMEKSMRRCLNTYVRWARQTGRNDVQRGLQLSEMLVAKGFREPYVPWRNRGDQRLRILRKAAGWTHAELAKRIGCDKRAAMEWERQSVRSAFRDDFFGGIPRKWHRQALAAFGLTATEFLWFAPIRPTNGSPREAYITARDKALAKARQAIRDKKAARRRERRLTTRCQELAECENPYDEERYGSGSDHKVPLESFPRPANSIQREYDLLRIVRRSIRARWLPAETRTRERLGEEPSPAEVAFRSGMRRARHHRGNVVRHRATRDDAQHEQVLDPQPPQLADKGGSSHHGVLAVGALETPQPESESPTVAA